MAHYAGVSGSTVSRLINGTCVVSPARVATHERGGHGVRRNGSTREEGRWMGWCPVQAVRYSHSTACSPSRGSGASTPKRRRGGSGSRCMSAASAPPVQIEARRPCLAPLVGKHPKPPLVNGAISGEGPAAENDVTTGATRSTDALPAPLVAGWNPATIGAAQAYRELGLQVLHDPSPFGLHDFEGSIAWSRI